MKPKAKGDNEPTVLLPPPPAHPVQTGGPRPPGILLAGAVLSGLLFVGGIGLALWPNPGQPDPAAPASAPAESPPALSLRLASEPELEADMPDRLTIFRFAANPAVVVLDFASLATQGEMLNRVAAFVEKAGLPHDHVLNDAALTDAIRASGASPETFYYGHDYRAADLAGFFRAADRDHVGLNAEEEWLRDLVNRLGWLSANVPAGALISLPRVGADKLVDTLARRTILHHELSHGEYFTNPIYAEYSADFWNHVLTQTEREQVRRFLAAEGYDQANEDLMENEAQAYLMHTRDARFFSASLVGWSEARLAELRARFLLNMPHGWLYDSTPKG